MKKMLAVLALVFPLLTRAASSVETTKPIFDSDVVSSGATWNSSTVNLASVTAIEVFVDNTSGGGLRDLTMTSFAPDGVTTIDSVLLRRVAYGTAPTGSSYAPGRVRGYLGPTPPGGTTGTFLLYDATSAAATALDSGIISTEDSDLVIVNADASGGTTQMTPSDVRDDDTSRNYGAATAAGTNTMTWGPGMVIGSVFNLSVSGAIPRRARFQTSSAGPSNTVRLRVWSKGRIPGTFTVPMLLPTKARFSLSAANGTVRAWGIAR